ncbi:MAG: hypothetical protein KAW47_03050, partial [Thermoplasmatales archaeon]|nr:hypothetical protein [Thermoplasmatales archaeon]
LIQTEWAWARETIDNNAAIKKILILFISHSFLIYVIASSGLKPVNRLQADLSRIAVDSIKAAVIPIGIIFVFIPNKVVAEGDGG